MYPSKCLEKAVARGKALLIVANVAARGQSFCETCGAPRHSAGGRFCRPCYLRRAEPRKAMREIRKQLAFIRREMKLRWLYEAQN